MISKCLPAVIACMWCTCCFAQKPVAERLDSFLSVMAQHHMFNGSILVAEKGKLLYTKSFGYADADKKIANSDTCSFNLASMTKPFTCLAVLQLVQKGKAGLEDAVVKYLPDFPYPNVTIRHLLTHTSGVPNVEKFERPYIDQHPDEIMGNEKIYADLVALKLPQEFQPGDKWSYSNMGYMTLCRLVEKISGMLFGAYLEKYIFTPAGMKHSWLRNPASPNTPRYIIPRMYMSEYKNVDSLDHRKVYTHYNLGGGQGAGNIVSTLQDLFRFDNALSAGKLLSPALLDLAFTPATLNNGKPARVGGASRYYGMGWNVVTDTAGAKTVFHDGHIIGIVTMLYKNIAKGQTIIFYDNMESPAFFQKIGAVARIINNGQTGNFRPTESLARVYGVALVSKGVDYATAKFNELKDDTLHYYVDELEINRLGYDLLASNADFAGYRALALEAFKINTLLFHSANSYDSYADALREDGQADEAISMYRKSLSMNPANSAGKRNLEKLLAKKEAAK